MSNKKSVQLKPTLQLLIAGASIVIGVAGCTQQPQKVQALSNASLKQTDLVNPGRAGADVQALVKLGPRVAGTPVMEKASAYLIQEYRKAGYMAEVQTFTYPKFEDLGSNLSLDGRTIAGIALNGSLAGKPTARLVAVPNVGNSADFASVDVKGVIAIVQRGEIRFLQKAENAAAAGAVGLIIVNTTSDSLSGTLGGKTKIPVLGLSGDLGKPLIERVRNQPLNVALNVNTRQRVVTGRNVVAHLKGVTRPSVLLGGHYDSVPGAPGANDNASGTAVVLEIARNLSTTPLARQSWFVAFDGEEDGLHGSRAFVSKAEPEFLQGLKGMLNFDMVGVNNKLLVGGTKSLTTLAQATDPGVSTFGGSGGSDHAPFAAAEVPVLFFYRGQEPNYHSPNDKQVDSKLLDETAGVGLDVVKRLLRFDSSSLDQGSQKQTNSTFPFTAVTKIR
jgi:Zn-dependent M28 family amino/carboxypeptidase